MVLLQRYAYSALVLTTLIGNTAAAAVAAVDVVADVADSPAGLQRHQALAVEAAALAPTRQPPCFGHSGVDPSQCLSRGSWSPQLHLLQASAAARRGAGAASEPLLPESAAAAAVASPSMSGVEVIATSVPSSSLMTATNATVGQQQQGQEQHQERQQKQPEQQEVPQQQQQQQHQPQQQQPQLQLPEFAAGRADGSPQPTSEPAAATQPEAGELVVTSKSATAADAEAASLPMASLALLPSDFFPSGSPSPPLPPLQHQQHQQKQQSGKVSLMQVGQRAIEEDDLATEEGDVVQGLVFTMICLIIVVGIYVLVFNEYKPGEAAYPAPFDGADYAQRSSGWFHPWSAPPAASSLLPSRPAWQRPGSQAQAPGKLTSTKSLAARETLRPADALRTSFGMPGTPPTTAPGTQAGVTNGNVPRTEDWYPELPVLYPNLVMPVAHTRLAVPLATLSQSEFEVDVLGLSGVPLLSAALVERNGASVIEIVFQGVRLLAVVTAELEILGADGTFLGVLKRDGAMPQLGVADGPQLVLRDREGRPILLCVATRKDAWGCDFKISSVSAGRIVERATAVRQPAVRLPAEHYEVVANPNVDAVLVLAVLLAAVCFETKYPNLAVPASASGRPSTAVGGSMMGLNNIA